MIKIFAVVVCLLLFMQGCSLNNKEGDKAEEGVYSVADFSNVKIGMTYDEVVNAVGEPTDSIGSGFVWQRYKLDDGWYVIVLFLGDTLFDMRIVDYKNDRAFKLQTDQGKSNNGMSEETLPKKYENYYEAYLEILIESKPVLTNEQLSDVQKNMGLDIGDGRIAILNVYGDETPELLYMYTDTEYSNSLKIYTYSEKEGVEFVSDTVVYDAAGGESHYCIFITSEGELMRYYSQSGLYYHSGFWKIIPDQYLESIDYEDIYRNSAQLYCEVSEEGKMVYFQCGKEISSEQYDKNARDAIGKISQVLFQGAEIGGNEFALYKDEFWRDVTPYETDYMSYSGAIAWLETQKKNQAE